MKAKTKRLLAAVHDIYIPTYDPCVYYKRIPVEYETCGMPVWGVNPKNGYEYEVECVVEFDVYHGCGREDSYDYDPPSIEYLEVWHFRAKVGMWHSMSISGDTYKSICRTLLERVREDHQNYKDELKYQSEYYD